MPGKQQNRLTHDKVLDIDDGLRDNLHKVEGTDLWVYSDGMSDEIIATHVGCQAPAVASHRIKRYGYLSTERYRQERGSRAKEVTARFEELEGRVKAIEDAIKSQTTINF